MLHPPPAVTPTLWGIICHPKTSGQRCQVTLRLLEVSPQCPCPVAPSPGSFLEG